MNMKLYHGSENIIMSPSLKLAKPKNDYGKGFYMTENYDLAGEWACKKMKDGYINVYSLDTGKLKVLNLNDKKYNILHWLTILIQNRSFDLDSDIANDAYDYLIKNYNIDYEKYDVIIGYRADDSYFSFANDFIENSISLKKLEFAFTLGDLGIQYVLKSEKAFNVLRFEEAVDAKKEIYYPKFLERDNKARMIYKEYKNIYDKSYKEIYIKDIMEQK